MPLIYIAIICSFFFCLHASPLIGVIFFQILFQKNILRTTVNGTCKNFQPIKTSDLTPPNAGDKIDVDKDVHFLLWTNENPTEDYEIVYNDLFSITNSPFQVSTAPPKNLSKFDNK